MLEESWQRVWCEVGEEEGVHDKPAEVVCREKWKGAVGQLRDVKFYSLCKCTTQGVNLLKSRRMIHLPTEII